MKLLGSYIYSRRNCLLLLVLFCVIFLVVFYLSDLAHSELRYSLQLCGGVGLGIAIADFRNFAKKHRRLQNLLECPELMGEHMPHSDNTIEADYQLLCEALIDSARRERSNADIAYNDMTDYFTLWAHQIKTPIAAMQLLLNSENEALTREELSEQLFRIEQYAQMVLQYIRLSDDSSDYVFAPCELDSLIRSCVRKFAPIFIRKRLSLRYEPTGREIVTDEKWLAFIIEQLLSNSLKYTKSGFVSIYMDENRPQTLVIEDSGIGISPEDLPRIFDKGFTGYNGRSNKKSTGIGLYLCSKIAKKLGIGLSISSTPAIGTKVFVDLSRRDRIIE